MNNAERKIFWDTLCDMRDTNIERIKALSNAIVLPDYLCRFRSVSENALAQLQENKLYYSSADYYDDPFDTFIHVDYNQITAYYKLLKQLLDSNDPSFLDFIEKVGLRIGVNPEQFLNSMREHPLDLQHIPDRIKQTRTFIQKNLFSICFCENAFNETLWLKYADNYSGFALVYNIKNSSTFLCGKNNECNGCPSSHEKPSIYPVYYTEQSYDATRFALACLLWNTRGNTCPQIVNSTYNLVTWEAERISLIKKKCHEYDEEWRMIRPSMTPVRTCIKMRPTKIILGLRMAENKRALVISAAKIAGISNIEELYIDDSDQLASRPLLNG